MLIRLLPGATPTSILKPLQQLRADTRNLETRHYTDPVEHREAYVRWANDAIRALRHAVAADSLEKLIRTPVFWHIQTMPALATGTKDTIVTEVEARKAELEKLYIDLEAMIDRWSTARIVVPDTSMFIRHGKLREWDLAPILNLAQNEPLHIVIPMVIIDELDRLKEASKQHTRWRAQYTTSVIDDVLPDPTGPGVLRTQGYEPDRGPVTVEVVLDPPGHRRLPDNDDEFVDQAAAVNGLTDQPITVLTYDTGQSMRARGRGLTCHKLADPPQGDEPQRK